MATKRVIVYAMHEGEIARAHQALSNPIDTESYVLGDIDEAAIPGLEAEGLIVEQISPPAQAPETFTRLRRGVEETVVATESVEGGGVMTAPTGADEIELPPAGVVTTWVVQVDGPLLDETRGAISVTGTRLLERLPEFGYLAKATPEQAAEVLALPGVTDVAHGTAPTPAPPAPAAMDGGEVADETWDVVLSEPADREPLVAWLEQQGAAVVASSGRKVRFIAPGDSPVPDGVTEQALGSKITPYSPPVLYNDIARGILRVSDAQDPSLDLPYRGAGQVVAIADTGIDATHPDFKGRLQAVGLATPGNPGDPVGHGTHVAGSILGDGNASGGQLRGVAPEATAYFQALANAQGVLVGLPLELKDLFQDAYDHGARIHNDSWGARTAGEYTANSIEIDDYVWEHPDMLIVVAAGNDGTAASRMHTKPGWVDWVSVGSPASSKNGLTVGAARSSRSDGALAGKTYADAWPGNFPDPPIGAEAVSGDSESMAAFSSRGPCTDARIKPDVVAPGTDILSTRAAGAPANEFWGEYPPNPKYAFMGGTSMSAPLVAGCAALVREHYVKDRGVKPSAALLKATIIAGARWLGGNDACADFAEFPNFNQGFGMVDLSSSVPNPVEPGLRLVFADTWKDATMQFGRTGQRFRFSVDAGAALPLRICLTYTDPPARSLQNDLSLIVQDPIGVKLVGNAGLPLRLTALDPTNNVEVIRLPAPPGGTYLIQITAKNLLVTPQSFALVVTGDLASDLRRVPG